MTCTLTLPDITATQRMASDVAACMRDGDVLLLRGPVGAGKTTFTGLLATALGIEEPVRSPTYTIAHEYRHADHERRLAHLDLYRQVDALDDAAWGDIEPYLDATWTCVEWSQVGEPRLAHRPCWKLNFDHVSRDARIVRIEAPSGDRTEEFVQRVAAHA